MLGTEIGRPMGPGAAAAIARWHAEDNELRQVFIQRPETVTDPRTERGMRAFANMAARLKGELSTMIVVEGPKGTDHRDVIRAFADAFKPVAHDKSALAVILVAGLERHDDFAIPMRWISADDIGVNLLWIEHRLVRRFVDRFAGVFVQLRFDIEAFKMTDAATKKNPNDRFGPGGKMRFAIGRPPGSGSFRPGCALAEEHRAKRQAGKSHSGVGKE